MTQTASRIDVRTVAPRDRHPLIFSTFAALAKGEALELVNDHDPRPLYYQFNAQMPGQFAWDCLQTGPDLWRVAITRTQDGPAPDAAGSCCGGGCGG
ncbi:DUF2249 domain-containing protein [Ramlibacter sp. PS3R-8]|uniref:DUF2249 domain-containing protein n=1 Tax=Ramlibacter sp. PS3R-8 TaxID=3133437 RepID=UPI00309FDCBA